MFELNARAEMTMSSREIAELTGKRHDNVKVDVSKMLDELNLDVLKFQDIYLDSMNRKQTEYRLNRELTECLLLGYSAKARLAVLRKLDELEKRASQPSWLKNVSPQALAVIEDLNVQLESAKPKVEFVDTYVNRDALLNATQVAQPMGLSAVKMNRMLDELGGVYNQSVKRGRAFVASFVKKGYGKMIPTDAGYPQPMFTTEGAYWITQQLKSESAA